MTAKPLARLVKCEKSQKKVSFCLLSRKFYTFAIDFLQNPIAAYRPKADKSNYIISLTKNKKAYDLLV